MTKDDSNENNLDVEGRGIGQRVLNSKRGEETARETLPATLTIVHQFGHWITNIREYVRRERFVPARADRACNAHKIDPRGGSNNRLFRSSRRWNPAQVSSLSLSLSLSLLAIIRATDIYESDYWRSRNEVRQHVFTEVARRFYYFREARNRRSSLVSLAFRGIHMCTFTFINSFADPPWNACQRMEFHTRSPPGRENNRLVSRVSFFFFFLVRGESILDDLDRECRTDNDKLVRKLIVGARWSGLSTRDREKIERRLL